MFEWRQTDGACLVDFPVAAIFWVLGGPTWKLLAIERRNFLLSCRKVGRCQENHESERLDVAMKFGIFFGLGGCRCSQG